MAALKRELGLFSAIGLGLGSILGTGVFISIGIAADITGSSVILAIILAALLAACNALSSAQLAAAHPVSGGTYEYGYRLIGTRTGFTAGWMFLLAKSASAATAAMGVVIYLFSQWGLPSGALAILLALIIIVLMTGLVASGLRRSNRVNTIVVSLTLTTLFAFIIVAIFKYDAMTPKMFELQLLEQTPPALPLLEATALMFVAYTGYGRIATMGEEVKNPKWIIPRAIIATLLVSAVLYVLVAIALVITIGDNLFLDADGTSYTLNDAARFLNIPGLGLILSIGAITAMLGVLLNLILGLSRVALAMARRGDLPPGLAKINATGSPTVAVISVGGFIVALIIVSLGDIRTAWTFSAFTVLIYYAITNLAALRQPSSERLYPRWISAAGLMGCLGLAAFVPKEIWMLGLGLILLGWIWQRGFQALAARRLGE